jgi:hypothetical protein
MGFRIYNWMTCTSKIQGASAHSFFYYFIGSSVSWSWSATYKTHTHLPSTPSPLSISASTPSPPLRSRVRQPAEAGANEEEPEKAMNNANWGAPLVLGGVAGNPDAGCASKTTGGYKDRGCLSHR